MTRQGLQSVLVLAFLSGPCRGEQPPRLQPAAGVQQLTAELKSPDPAIRRKAVEGLGQIGAPAAAAVPALIDRLTDPDENVRMATTDALGFIGPPAIPLLSKALSDPDQVVRRGAAYAIGKMGMAARPAQSALVDRLRQEQDGRARAYVLWSLGQLKADPSVLAAPVRAGTRDGAAVVRKTAVGLLGEIGLPASDAVALLITALNDADPVVRRAAAHTLYISFGAAAAPAVPSLIRLLDDGDPEVRRSVVTWSWWEKLPKDVAPLYLAALRSSDAAVRGSAVRYTAWAASKLRGSDAAPGLRAALAGNLGDPSETIRGDAAKALRAIGATGDRQLLPVLIAALGDDSEVVREEVAATLADLGAEAAPARSALLVAGNDPNGKVQLHAVRALVAISATLQSYGDLDPLLKSSHSALRRSAVAALVRCRDKRAEAAALRALDDADEEVARAAWLVLEDLPSSPQLVEQIRSQLARPGQPPHLVYYLNSIVRRWGAVAAVPEVSRRILTVDGMDETGNLACETLLELGWQPQATVSTLAGALAASQWSDRFAAASDLAGLILCEQEPGAVVRMISAGNRTGTWIAILVEGLQHEEEAVRRQAAEAIAVIGPTARDAAPVLTAMLAEGDRQPRDAVIGALVALGAHGRSVLPVLVAQLAAADSQSRCAAAWWLKGLGPVAEPAIPALVARLGDHGECGKSTAGSAAAHALWRIGLPAMPALSGVLTHGAAPARVNAAWAVRLIVMDSHHLPALPVLVAGLRDSEPEVRATMAQALGELGSDAGEALAALEAFCDREPDGEVRLAACRAAQTIRTGAAKQ